MDIQGFRNSPSVTAIFSNLGMGLCGIFLCIYEVVVFGLHIHLWCSWTFDYRIKKWYGCSLITHRWSPFKLHWHHNWFHQCWFMCAIMKRANIHLSNICSRFRLAHFIFTEFEIEVVVFFPFYHHHKIWLYLFGKRKKKARTEWLLIMKGYNDALKIMKLVFMCFSEWQGILPVTGKSQWWFSLCCCGNKYEESWSLRDSGSAVRSDTHQHYKNCVCICNVYENVAYIYLRCFKLLSF